MPAYRAVVLDDVAVADASPRFWDALAQAVRQRGLGLLVLAANAPSRAAATATRRLKRCCRCAPSRPRWPADGGGLAVDKSGSMGRQRRRRPLPPGAAGRKLDSARTWAPATRWALLVFDVAPRVLLPLAAAAALPTLQRDWPVSPIGGTRLAPALQAAIDELERAGNARRVLVLVTDSFVDDTPVDEWRARLERARIETLALAVRAGRRCGRAAAPGRRRCRPGAARRPGGGTAGHARRAGTAPGAHRTRPIAVVQAEALPFPPGRLQDWPPIAAYAVTRARPRG